MNDWIFVIVVWSLMIFWLIADIMKEKEIFKAYEKMSLKDKKEVCARRFVR